MTEYENRSTSLETALSFPIEYKHFLDCVHCGLCTSACPTYLELGTEADGPRGRIHLMRAMVDGRLAPEPEAMRHLSLCLDCRACETACPSGVQYGRLIEPFRVWMSQQKKISKKQERFLQKFFLPLFPYKKRLRALLMPVYFLQKLGLDSIIERTGILRYLPRTLSRLYGMLPKLTQEPPLPEFLPAKGPKRATVALLTGCVADVLFRHTHWASARVLQENGCDVWIPQEQGCCGALYLHTGKEEPAIDCAIQQTKVFSHHKIDAVISNVAGCGAMLKEYENLAIPETHKESVKEFSHKVKDISEFLLELGLVPPMGEISIKAVYHDACHLLHAQKIESPPREILRNIPGLELLSLEECSICCGAAGAYNLLEPEMANRLVTRKTKHIQETKADAVFVANAGCLLHIGQKLREENKSYWLAHPIEVLDRSYRKI